MATTNGGEEFGAGSQGPVVSLVSMPFKDLRHPPIQFGILEHCLQRAGIPARTHSLELAFMEHLYARTAPLAEGERLSMADYQDVVEHYSILHLGDWIFKVPPYAEPSPDDDEYLAYVCASGFSENAIANAIHMRSLVPDFLAAAADDVLAGKPRVVGFTTSLQEYLPCLVLAKLLKTRDPSLTIVFGGDNCDGPMGTALHECFPWVDIVVRGEGERVLVEVVRDVLAGRPVRPQPGLCYRVEGQPVIIPEDDRSPLPMDEIPAPVYDEYFEHLSRSPLRAEIWPGVAILFESSRGCWWGAKSHCTFCGLNGSTMAFRSKPAARVAEEIQSLAAQYKVLYFVAVDDIIDLQYVSELFPRLRSAGCDLDIFYETKANLKKEQLRAFYDAGITAIQPGIESLSTPVLRLMRKGVTALQNLRLLKWCAEIGMVPAWNHLYGIPGEPPEEYDRIAQLIPSLVHFTPPNTMAVQLERFSPYFDRPAEFGIEIIQPKPHYRFLFRVDSEQLADLAYDFEFRYLDGRDPASYTAPLREAVQKWQQLHKKALGSLSYRRGPGFLIVEDRRPGLEPADYCFDELEARIYLACDAGVTLNALQAQLAAEGEDTFELREIEEFLNELIDARLLYREGNTFLSLAISANGAAARSRTGLDEAEGAE